jgi:hypothetical protein
MSQKKKSTQKELEEKSWIDVAKEACIDILKTLVDKKRCDLINAKIKKTVQTIYTKYTGDEDGTVTVEIIPNHTDEEIGISLKTEYEKTVSVKLPQKK